MDDENTEEMLYEAAMVKEMFAMTIEQFEKFKHGVKVACYHSDVEFIRALGVLLTHADLKDSVKIIHTWRNICTQEEMKYRIWKAKLNANTEE